MEFLKKLIKKISPGVKKGFGIYLSQASTLEVVEYDYDLGEILNFKSVPFEYNSVQRDINIEAFDLALQSVLKTFEISSQYPVSFTIPSIFINQTNLPLDLNDSEIQTALLSESEKNYIFKRTEPAVSWNIISANKENQQSTILYTAIQKIQVEKLDELFKRQGIKLVAIETAYEAFIRGISVSGLVDEYIENNLSWHALVIKNNINAVITLKGSQVLNIKESPFALSAFEPDDLYSSLVSNLVEKIQEYPIDALVISNYSNLIDINTLIGSFDFKCPVIKIQNNYHKTEPVFTYERDPNREPINPEVIGSACRKIAPVKFGFNFLSGSGNERMPGLLETLGVTGNPLHVILLGLITVAFVLISFVSLITLPINGYLEDQIFQLVVKCSEYKQKFDKPEVKTFNLFDTVMSGFDNNKKISTSYYAISDVIPEKVWIESVSVDESLNADIIGKAYTVEDIVNYYQNLLSVVQFNNLKIKSIRVVGENSGMSGTTSDVSINNVSEKNPSQPQVPANPWSTQPAGPSALPPPPSSAAPMNSISGIIGPKYYEFHFGNPATDVVDTSTNTNTPEQQNQFVNGLGNLTKNLKL